MNRLRVKAGLLAMSLAEAVCIRLSGADPRPVSGAAVELPPMMVEESVSSAPWYYVNAGGTEFLSRCSPSTTRAFVEGWLTKMQLVRVLVPEAFMARMDVPSIFVLYSQDLKQTVSAEIQRELQGVEERTAKSEFARKTDFARENRVNIAPNMRLSDRDMQASIVYIEEALFDAAGMSVAPGHVRFLLAGRVPDLPTWLVEGIERTWRSADFVLEPITLNPMTWNSRGESEALASDPTRPRAVLPASELFASDALRMTETRHARRVEARAATQELFFRWALVTGGPTRDALWKLAARGGDGPVTEEIFEAEFGFGFSELRDRLSDYLPKAVAEFARIRPGRLPPLPDFEVELATPNEVARVRGEWERLAIGHVQRRLPQVREPYIVQARRTLRRAYDSGDRDSRLLATIGLCEVDASNEKAAREFLEPAIAAGVLRPRAYYELARMRFAELRQGVPDSKVFSFTELAPVFGPLRRALKQQPPLAEVYVMLAEAWARCELAPNYEEFAELELGGRLFGRRPAVGFPIAVALALHGKKPEAIAVLDSSNTSAMDDTMRAAIKRLRGDLTASLTRAAAEEAAGTRP